MRVAEYPLVDGITVHMPHQLTYQKVSLAPAHPTEASRLMLPTTLTRVQEIGGTPPHSGDITALSGEPEYSERYSCR